MADKRTFVVQVGGMLVVASDGQVIASTPPTVLSDLDEVEVNAIAAGMAELTAKLAKSGMFTDEFNDARKLAAA